MPTVKMQSVNFYKVMLSVIVLNVVFLSVMLSTQLLRIFYYNFKVVLRVILVNLTS